MTDEALEGRRHNNWTTTSHFTMTNIPPMSVDEQLAHIQRQKGYMEKLLELDLLEQRVKGLQGGAVFGQAHLPTPSQPMQSMERPTPTPSATITTIDLTTPSPRALQMKREPKQEKSTSPATAAVVNQEHAQQSNISPEADQAPVEARASRKRPRGDADGQPSDAGLPTNAIPSQEEAASANGRASKAKKKYQGDPLFATVVDDPEYRTIIKAPDTAEGESLVELNCKFCGANCATGSGTKLLFKGDSSWRGHICGIHRRDVPAGIRVTAQYLLENCVTMRKLTPDETNAVYDHKHTEFAVVPKVFPPAPKSKRPKVNAARVYGEDEAEKQMLEAVEAPLNRAIADREMIGNERNFYPNDEAGDDSDYAEYAQEDRPFEMSTRKGGRRTRDTPDFAVGRVE